MYQLTIAIYSVIRQFLEEDDACAMRSWCTTRPYIVDFAAAPQIKAYTATVCTTLFTFRDASGWLNVAAYAVTGRRTTRSVVFVLDFGSFYTYPSAC